MKCENSMTLSNCQEEHNCGRSFALKRSGGNANKNTASLVCRKKFNDCINKIKPFTTYRVFVEQELIRLKISNVTKKDILELHSEIHSSTNPCMLRYAAKYSYKIGTKSLEFLEMMMLVIMTIMRAMVKFV